VLTRERLGVIAADFLEGDVALPALVDLAEMPGDMRQAGTGLLEHQIPVVSRVRCFEALLERQPPGLPGGRVCLARAGRGRRGGRDRGGRDSPGTRGGAGRLRQHRGGGKREGDQSAKKRIDYPSLVCEEAHRLSVSRL